MVRVRWGSNSKIIDESAGQLIATSYSNL